ncbi:MAG TPA: Hpt domain-containing protein [Rhizomicrobium sp.]|jgi:HPt (histidine-containing phosphotransfer) domain-containing protein
MAKSQIEIFMPPNILKARLGGTIVGLDSGALARAEAAVADLASEYPNWIKADVDALVAANAERTTGGANAKQALMRTAHDLKSQGAHFGYPLIGRAAASLCDLLDVNGEAPAPLVDAHVNAIRAFLRDHAEADNEDTALKLIAELEQQTAEYRKAVA